MEHLYIDSDGRRRHGIGVQCGVCGKDFSTRKDQPAKYCSLMCSREARKTNRLVACVKCGKTFAIRQSRMNQSKSGMVFCSRKCKDEAQKIGGVSAIMPPHYGLSHGKHLWDRLIHDDPDAKCMGCGEPRRFLLCVHHIDGDRENNVQENLEVVCGNCHIIRHLKQVKGEWVYCTKVMTPRDLLVEFTALDNSPRLHSGAIS